MSSPSQPDQDLSSKGTTEALLESLSLTRSGRSCSMVAATGTHHPGEPVLRFIRDPKLPVPALHDIVPSDFCEDSITVNPDPRLSGALIDSITDSIGAIHGASRRLLGSSVFLIVFERAEGPPERGGRRLCCACGRWSRPPREGKILGARGSGVCPGGPNWPRSSCAAHLYSTGAASNSKLKPPCAVYFLCVAQVVVVNGWHRRRENPGAHGQVQVPCFLNSWWKWNCWKVGAAGEKN